jgi:hypothetical protein
LAFFKVTWTVSPTRTRIIGPGTVPLNVQKRYCTPLASVPVISFVSSSTATVAGRRRWMGGGTAGGATSTADSCSDEAATVSVSFAYTNGKPTTPSIAARTSVGSQAILSHILPARHRRAGSSLVT